jgi:RIO kinase 1
MIVIEMKNERDNFEEDDDERFTDYIDNLEKDSIDRNRIRTIDQSKKRAAVESVFDERTLLLLNKLVMNGILKNVIGLISAGKEANIYLAYDPEEREVAIKIYKIDSNTSKWMREYIIGDPRFKKMPHNISKIIYLWAGKEFKNLKRAKSAGLSVPQPIYVKDNILIMEYIGVGMTPAPRLKEVRSPDNISDLINVILTFIKELYQKARLVHGDLSEFNILYHDQKPVVIDISQAVDIQHPKAEIYLVRDIKNVFSYLEKFGYELPDPNNFYMEVINLG